MGKPELIGKYTVTYNYLQYYSIEKIEESFRAEMYNKKVEMLHKLAVESDDAIQLGEKKNKEELI